MRIRGIQKADFDYIVAVLDRWWGGPSVERAHPIFFYELGKHALIAETDEGDLVGFLLGFVAPTDPATAYIHLVGIHPDHRRQGVGKLLYQEFISRCQKAGAARMKAIAAPGNDGSVRFHEALGFRASEEQDYAGRDRTRVVFTKAL